MTTAIAPAPTTNGAHKTLAPAAGDETRIERIPVDDASPFANMLDTAKFEHMWRVAQMFSKSKLVPQHFQGDPNSCWIACQMAVRLGVDPFMMMQNTYIVQGKPGMEAKLTIALVNSSGIFRGPIQWKVQGEGMERSATAFAIHAKTGELCECTVSMAVAKAEGWIDKGGSKWKTMPDQMLRYRSAAWFARLYCPERIMGMQTVDELDDIAPARVTVENTARSASGLQRRLSPAATEIIDDPRPTQEELPSQVIDTDTGEVTEVTKAAASTAPVFEGKGANEAHEAWSALCQQAYDATAAEGEALFDLVANFIANVDEEREKPYTPKDLSNKAIRGYVMEKAAKADWKALQSE